MIMRSILYCLIISGVYCNLALANCLQPNLVYTIEGSLQNEELNWLGTYVYENNLNEFGIAAALEIQGEYYIDLIGQVPLGLKENKYQASEYFERALSHIPEGKDFTLVLEISGGHSGTADRIIDSLKGQCGTYQNKCKIKTYVPFFCGSICSQLFLIGNKRHATESSKFYFHSASDSITGHPLDNWVEERLTQWTEYSAIVSPSHNFQQGWIDEQSALGTFATRAGSKISAKELVDANLVTQILVDPLYEKILQDFEYSNQNGPIRTFRKYSKTLCKN